MRYTTTDGPKKPLNAIQEGSLGGKMGIAAYSLSKDTNRCQKMPISLGWRSDKGLMINDVISSSS